MSPPDSDDAEHEIEWTMGGASSVEESLRWERGVIQEHGFAVRYIVNPEKGEDHIPYAHTVGLTAKGLPELIAFRFDAVMATQLLGHLAHEMMRRNEAPSAGDLVAETPTGVIKVLACSAAVLAYIPGVKLQYPELPISARQLVMAVEGVFPGEPGYPVAYHQPTFPLHS